jgi:cubilin
MYVRFVSDFSVSGRGFRIWWDATSTGCGGVLSSPSGSLTSPGYPSTYGRNAECFWRIEVSQGSKVLFAFSDMDMESQMQTCNYDYVEVIFINKLFKNHRLGVVCSNFYQSIALETLYNFSFQFKSIR